MNRKTVAAILTPLLLAGCAAQSPSLTATPAAMARAESDVRATAAAFVTAFNTLDQQRFDELWADDATVFFPQPPFPIRRVDGKAEVIQWFKRFFDSQRKAGSSPGIDPKQLQVQMIGTSGAVISFHLGTSEEAAARRTLVLRSDAIGWRIVHLHGSSLTLPKK